MTQYMDSEMLGNYFKLLINKFYKVLCMREDNCVTLEKYLNSLIIELYGSKELIEVLNNDGEFITLLSIIRYFIDNPDEEIKIYKREVFKCIDIIKKLRFKYE